MFNRIWWRRGKPRGTREGGVKGGESIYMFVSIFARIPSWIGFGEVNIIFELSLRAMVIRPLFCNYGCCFVCISQCCCLRQGIPQFAKELHLPRHKTHRKSYYCACVFLAIIVFKPFFQFPYPLFHQELLALHPEVQPLREASQERLVPLVARVQRRLSRWRRHRRRMQVNLDFRLTLETG